MARKTSNQDQTPDKVIIFDSQARNLAFGDADPVGLRAKSFSVFLALAQQYPEPLSKEQLIEEVWGQAAVSDDSITQCIADIRRALGDKDHALVQTNPGVGYSLTVPAHQAGAVDPIAERPPVPVRLLAGIATVVVVAVVAAFFIARPFISPSPSTVEAAATKPAVGVLTFETLGANPRLEEFSEALRNDTVFALSDLDTVSVLSPTVLDEEAMTSMTPMRTYAARGARFVVGGTIQSVTSGLRVSAHLIDTDTGKIGWVRRWESEQEDWVSIQDEVVKALAAELANPWSGHITGLGSDLANEGGDGTDVASHIMLGAQYFGTFEIEDLEQAEHHFRRALELEPQNGEAWAGLSFALGAMMPLVPPDDAKVLRGVRFDAGRQAHHSGKGNGRSMLAGSWTAAVRGNTEQLLKRMTGGAAKLSGDADALAMASLQAALVSELYGEAILWGEQALAINADPPAWHHLGVGIARYFQDDYGSAKEALVKAPPAYPTTLIFLTASHIKAGEVDQAQAVMARLRMLHNQFTVKGFLDSVFIAPAAKVTKLRETLSAGGIPSD